MVALARAAAPRVSVTQFGAIKLEHYTLVAELKETYGELVSQDGRFAQSTAHIRCPHQAVLA